MNYRAKQTLIAIGLLAIIGSVGAQTWYTHRLAEKLKSVESQQVAESSPQSDFFNTDSGNPWTWMQDDMRRMQAQMDHFFDSAFSNAPMMDHGIWSNDSRVSLSEEGDNYVVKRKSPARIKTTSR